MSDNEYDLISAKKYIKPDNAGEFCVLSTATTSDTLQQNEQMEWEAKRARRVTSEHIRTKGGNRAGQAPAPFFYFPEKGRAGKQVILETYKAGRVGGQAIAQKQGGRPGSQGMSYIFGK